jgi:hypothetical protein
MLIEAFFLPPFRFPCARGPLRLRLALSYGSEELLRCSVMMYILRRSRAVLSKQTLPQQALAKTLGLDQMRITPRG